MCLCIYMYIRIKKKFFFKFVKNRKNSRTCGYLHALKSNLTFGRRLFISTFEILVLFFFNVPPVARSLPGPRVARLEGWNIDCRMRHFSPAVLGSPVLKDGI